MNVVIVGGFWFPHGPASASRIRNLALGLRDCGARVHVIAMAPQPRASDNEDGSREYHGVSYEYVAPTTAVIDGWRDAERSIPRLRGRVSDKLRWFAGLYGATPFARRRLRERIDRRQCDLVVVYDRSALRMIPLARLCRARGVPTVLDVVEISEHLSGGRRNAIYWDFRAGMRAAPRLFDGFTLITAGLETLYRGMGCARTLVLPGIEEWPEASLPEPTGRATFHLTYVGALQSRDAPELLFDAMRLLARRKLPIVLDVVGHYEGTPRGAHFKALCAADPALGSVVRFLGTMSDAGLADQLRASDGLVLTRRSAPTEELSFPTRLVEYLRYGRPVFVSDVGDVSRYLRDLREVVLLHTGDAQRVADQVAQVVARPDRGAALGHCGRDAGARAFDRTTHAARLLDFAARLRPGAA
jgi:glycosyltransferase involved in cell wall biosynthesis